MLTLLEAAKLKSGEVIRSAVIEHFARSSETLNALHFLNIKGNAYKYTIEKALPGVGFRGINEGFSESTGILNPQIEALAIAGGDLDVDKFIIDTMGPQQRTSQELMKVKALAASITKKIYKGDSVLNPKEFDGFQKRLGGSQLIPAGGTSGGDALSLEKLDEAIDACDNPTHLAMNKTMRRKFTKAARDQSVAGRIDWALDSFGRRVYKYNDIPILLVERDEEDNEILPFSEENPGGGTPASTSIYILNLNPEAIAGIQDKIMEVRDLGELQSKSSFRTRVEWFLSIGMWLPRSAARLSGIKNADITA